MSISHPGADIRYQTYQPFHRQRKALTPAFSNTAVRKLINVFFDSAYKVRSSLADIEAYLECSFFKCKSVWDSMIDSNTEGAVIDVQLWYVQLEFKYIAETKHLHCIKPRMNNIA